MGRGTISARRRTRRQTYRHVLFTKGMLNQWRVGMKLRSGRERKSVRTYAAHVTESPFESKMGTGQSNCAGFCCLANVPSRCCGMHYYSLLPTTWLTCVSRRCQLFCLLWEGPIQCSGCPPFSCLICCFLFFSAAAQWSALFTFSSRSDDVLFSLSACAPVPI